MGYYYTITETAFDEAGCEVSCYQTEFEGKEEDYEKVASIWRKIATNSTDGSTYRLDENIGSERRVLKLKWDNGVFIYERVFCMENV